MIINSTFTWRGKKIVVKYRDVNSFADLPIKNCLQIYGVCFYQGKIVLTYGRSGKWNLAGGHVEKGETVEQTLIREVQEETNMRVLKQIPIGYQEILSPKENQGFQLRSACLVEPIGKFEKDPAGSVLSIRLVNPKNYRKYLDWGEIGDRLVSRAIQLLNI